MGLYLHKSISLLIENCSLISIEYFDGRKPLTGGYSMIISRFEAFKLRLRNGFFAAAVRCDPDFIAWKNIFLV